MVIYFVSLWVYLFDILSKLFVLIVLRFHAKKIIQPLYHLKFIHYWYFVGSYDGKMQMCYDVLTKYMLIRYLKLSDIFLMSLIFW